MSQKHLRTSDISRATGVHANTVRLYEEWGFLPPIPRGKSGYRLFTEAHLDQMKLARLAMREPWPGRRIRRDARALIRQAASGDLPGALAHAKTHLAMVHREQTQAEAAATYLEHWAAQQDAPALAIESRSISEAASLLDVTVDTLRHWERNNLISVPRNPANGYRCYGPAEIGRLRIIRLLTRSGYSTMAVLRMAQQLERGHRQGLRAALNPPESDEDIFYISDRWLTTLTNYEARARAMISQLQMMVSKAKPSTSAPG